MGKPLETSAFTGDINGIETMSESTTECSGTPRPTFCTPSCTPQGILNLRVLINIHPKFNKRVNA